MKMIMLLFGTMAISGCFKNDANKAYEILNDVFVDMALESTYDSYSFFALWGDTLKPRKQKGEYIVLVGDTMPSIREWDSSLEYVLPTEGEYAPLLHAVKRIKKTTPIKVDQSRITNTGLFTLAETKALNNNSSNVVGTLIIYQPFIQKDLACVVITRFTSPKSGLTEVLLLKKKSGKWNIEKRIRTEVW